jgi:hypothetical protein
VWRSLIFEQYAMFAIVIGTFALQVFLGIEPPSRISAPLNVLLALLPVFLWLIWSYFPERRAPQPRSGLILIFLMTALFGQAVGRPLINDVFRVNEWLPLSSALTRIAGYTVTTGLVQVGICYLVIRAIVWPNLIRSRYDFIAYGAVAALGYTLVPNVEFATTGNPLAYVVALHTAAQVVTLTMAMIVVGYGVSAVTIDNVSALAQPVIFAVAAGVVGASIPLFGGFLNASFSAGGTSLPRYLFAILFIGAFMTGLIFVMHFLYRFSERQSAERRLGTPE